MSDEKISLQLNAVIPIVLDTFIYSLLDTIDANSVLPACVYIIDNTENGFECKDIKYKFPLIVYRDPDGNRLDVNKSWEIGLTWSKETNVLYTTVLNDDLLLNTTFFKYILKSFEDLPKAGVVIPTTVDFANKHLITADFPHTYKFVRKREGWAFTIRNSLINKVLPIPKELETFGGDDWIYWNTRIAGYKWARMQGNVIVHYKGQTLRTDRKKYMEKSRVEKRVINSIIPQLLKKQGM
jgi:hypothetical protein